MITRKEGRLQKKKKKVFNIYQLNVFNFNKNKKTVQL